ncbi:MAG TPA: glycosyltransferase family A protein [Sphingobacteriaceae bacterium]|nr:glycosyltransferase family A protein [Sphingobacteriaceae bacterium]
MFSVVIPLYNKEQSIGNTILSVLKQSFEDFEIVLINDGSTDNSLREVRQITDSRIRIIDKPNGGVSSARNRGIEEARFEWIAFLDGDDLWEPNHLEILNELIIKFPRDKVFCTAYIRSDERAPLENDNSIVVVVEDYFREAINGPFFWTSVACINRAVFSDVGMFSLLLNRGEDLDLWARIGRRYRFVRSRMITAVYNLDAENRSDRHLKLEKTRVYNYDFSHTNSKSETEYYRRQIIISLLGMLKRRDWNDFFKLKNKHGNYVRYWDIIKYKI